MEVSQNQGFFERCRCDKDPLVGVQEDPHLRNVSRSVQIKTARPHGKALKLQEYSFRKDPDLRAQMNQNPPLAGSWFLWTFTTVHVTFKLETAAL